MISLREGIFLRPSGSLRRFCRLSRPDLAHAHANRPVDSGYRLDLDNLNVENRRKSFGVGRFLDNISVRHQILVWDTNVVKISLFTVKLFTLILSTLPTGRGESRGKHVGCLMRKCRHTLQHAVSTQPIAAADPLIAKQKTSWAARRRPSRKSCGALFVRVMTSRRNVARVVHRRRQRRPCRPTWNPRILPVRLPER